MGLKYLRSVAPVLFFLGLVLAAGCDKDPVRSPSPSFDPLPPNRAADIPILASLQWSWPEFNPPSEHFTLYFGSTFPPPLHDSLLTDTTFAVGPLDPGTTYYWRLTAHSDSAVTIASPVWRFTTTSSLTFPVVIGDTWHYSWYIQYTNFRPDTIGGTHPPITMGHSTTEIVGLDSTIGNTTGYVFRTDWNADMSSGAEYDFRYLTADGLYSYAYSGTSYVGPPKSTGETSRHYVVAGRSYPGMQDLLRSLRRQIAFSAHPTDTVIETPPVWELAFPLEVGRTWLYRSRELGSAWDMQKTVVNVEEVSVPAGEFKCMKIEWLWDVDDDGEWDSNIRGYDYLCSAGYIKREFIIKDVMVTDPYGNILYRHDVLDVYELTEAKLISPH